MPRYDWRPIDDILAAPQPPRPVAISGICGLGDLILITGSYDTFKSSFALELVWSLAGGGRFLGFFPIHCGIQRAAVVQCEIEQGNYETHRIQPRLKVAHTAPDLEILSKPDFTFDDLPHLEAEFDEMAFDVILFDPLGPMWPSWAQSEAFDENRKTHVSPFLKKLRALKRTIILVHHDTKGGQRASGSSALLNDPDVRITLDREYIAANGVSEKHLVRVRVKNRLQDPCKPFTARFDLDMHRLLYEDPRQLPNDH